MYPDRVLVVGVRGFKGTDETFDVPLSTQEAFALFAAQIDMWWPEASHAVKGRSCQLQLPAGLKSCPRMLSGRSKGPYPDSAHVEQRGEQPRIKAFRCEGVAFRQD